MKKWLIISVSLLLILGGCADLRVARDAYDLGSYQVAELHWSQLADKGFPEAEYRLANMLAEGYLGRDRIPEARPRYYRARNLGELRAEYRLGRFLLDYGEGPEDLEEAVTWLQAAAVRGDTDALFAMAELYEEGKGVPPDIGQARDILNCLAQNGDEVALYRLAAFEERQAPGNTPPPVAVKNYLQSADAGYQPARLRVAKLRLHGHGVVKDVPLALGAIETLSREGFGPATTRLGDMYRDGDFKPIDYNQAFRLYMLACTQDYDKAELRLADMLRKGWGTLKNLPAARLLYMKHVDRDDPGAVYGVGRVLEDMTPGKCVSPEAVQWYRLAADAGYPAARLRMAELMLEGIGVCSNVDKAFAMLQALSREGYGPATVRLGDLFRDGDLTSIDYGEAYRLYQLAYAGDYEKAELRIADLLRRGWGLEKDLYAALLLYLKYAEKRDAASAYDVGRILEEMAEPGPFPMNAVAWYEYARHIGHQGAGVRLAELYLEGKGVGQDVERAIDILERLVCEGYGSAVIRLGDVYRDGEYRSRDYHKAIEYYQTATTLCEDAAWLRLADVYENGPAGVRDFEKARSIYGNLANAGDGGAAYSLARMMEKRAGAAKLTPKIVNWYRMAAASGHVPARIRYADLQLEGNGVEQSVESALAAYRELADQNEGSAAYRLGRVYEDGKYVQRDYNKAAAFYLRAVDLGYHKAEENLADLYAAGLGVPQNLPLAAETYRKMAKNKDGKAAYKLGDLYSKHKTGMSADWQKQADRWYRRANALGYKKAREKMAALTETVPEPFGDSMEAVRKAADKGNGDAMLIYGVRVYRGDGIEANQVLGLALVLTAVRLDIDEAVMEADRLMVEADSPEITDQANELSLKMIESLGKGTLSLDKLEKSVK